jgi:hypothetical protein
MKRSPLALLAAGVVMAGAAGCGSSTSVRPGRTLQIELSEYRITPQAVHTGAGLLTIVVHNNGRLSHDLVISRGGFLEASTKPIPPGQSALVETALPPGRYLMASSRLSDQALGAYGTLDVGVH